MATEIYGIGSCQAKDNVGETVLVDGMDLSKCRIISDEHSDQEGTIPFFRIIGSVTRTKVIHNEKECENPFELKCWKHAAVPFVYVEGSLADDTDHPDAKSAASLLRFCQQPNIPLKIGLSVEGGTLERGGDDNKTLVRTVASGFAMTVKPANPKCSLFLKNDLQKSDFQMKTPARYFEALKKSEAKSSIFENRMFLLQYMTEKLKKSLADYHGAFTHIKCYNCGSSHRFFKSTDNMKNGCGKCGSFFSVSDIWKALNQ